MRFNFISLSNTVFYGVNHLSQQMVAQLDLALKAWLLDAPYVSQVHARLRREHAAETPDAKSDDLMSSKDSFCSEASCSVSVVKKLESLMEWLSVVKYRYFPNKTMNTGGVCFQLCC